LQPKPHPSQDVIKLFNLSDIAKSVRRVDAVTGEKINKLRKSYEGKVKELKILGRNKAVSTPGEWTPNLMGVPEDDWVNTNVRGKDPAVIAQGVDFMAKLNRACQVLPGKLPVDKDTLYKGIIGLEEQIAVKPVRPAGLDALRKPVPHAHTTPPSPAIKLARPGRVSSKRSYVDSSFSGYGDGINGDSDDDENGRGKKKLKRVCFPTNLHAIYGTYMHVHVLLCVVC
jgi:hypothetical protein